MTRRVEIELDSYRSLARGYGVRDMIMQITGKPPCYVTRLRGFSISEQTARNLLALAEATTNAEIAVTGRQDRRRSARDALLAAPPPRDFGGAA